MALKMPNSAMFSPIPTASVRRNRETWILKTDRTHIA